MTDAEYQCRLQAQLDADKAMRDWTEANAAATEVERSLAKAWELFESGVHGPPSVDALYEVNRVRAAANYKLIRALLRLRTVATPSA